MARSRILRTGVSLLVVLGLAGGGWYGWQQYAARSVAPAWRLGKIERGPITATVSATGTLNPVRSVQVGSQVSGQIKELYVDFNDVVTEGQMVARIDPQSFELKVRQAMADVDAARASVATQLAGAGAQRAAVSREEVNVAEARRDYERKLMLFDKGFISTADRDRALALVNTTQEQLKTTRAQLAVAEAQSKNAEAVVKQREAQLAQAQVDLDRTAIRAPADGVVIKRSVEAGQTVAASLQAPELFIIARNLTDMQVDASIDEAEVGRLRLGQRVTFTVDSFPGRIFNGEVRQIRKSAQVVQNVVTYTVVIGASNPDQSLLPGMTANVRVVTDQRESVLKIPNAALRFRPPGFVESVAAAPAQVRAAPGPAASAPSAGSAPPPAERAPAGASVPQPAAAPAPAAPAGDRAPAAQQFRQRLIDALKLDAGQQAKLEEIFAAQRPKLAALRELPEAERARALAKNRAELRSQIAAILKPEQKPHYAEILAGMSAQASARTAGAAAAQSAAAPARVAGAARAPQAQPGPVGGAGGPGGAQAAAAQQFRQRLINELKLDTEQQAKLDQIYAAQRSRQQALRGMSQDERSKAQERNRAELRMQISEILTAPQQQRYGEIIAETAGRQATRGRVFVLGDTGQPKAVALRLGLSDGVMTEVLGSELKEGGAVIIGATGARALAAGGRAGPPRLPF